MNNRPRMENEFTNWTLSFEYSWRKFVDGLFTQLIRPQFLPKDFFGRGHVAATLPIFAL